MAQGDLHLHNYQDELDTAEDDSTIDEFTIEQTGDLSDVAGIPRQDLKDEMDKLALDETNPPRTSEEEDIEADLESRDEDGDEER